MKTLKIILAIVITQFSLNTKAQIAINVNLGTPIITNWYSNCPSQVQYYYLPEIECYFDVHHEVYVYYGPNGWIRSPYLPNYCSNYVINSGYYYPIDYCGATPYVYFNNHQNYYYKNHYRNYRNEYYGKGNAYGRRAQVAYQGDRYNENRAQNQRQQVVYQNQNRNYTQVNNQGTVYTNNRGNRNGNYNSNGNSNRSNGHGRR